MSSRFVRASAYRHVFGQPAKEQWILNPKPIKSQESPNMCLNEKWIAYGAEGGGGPLVILANSRTHPERFDGASAAPKAIVHKGAVNDVKFCPFNDNILASGSEDCTIKITSIPSTYTGKQGSTDITTAAASLDGHGKKINYVQWHPTANNIISSTSGDNTVKVWDVSEQKECFSFDCVQQAHCLEWNEDGSLLMVSCKDEVIRVIDPRANSTTEAKLPGRTQRAFFADRLGKIFAAGHSKNFRTLTVFDPKDMSKPLGTQDIDQSAGAFMGMFDPDNSVLYLAGAGDSTIKYYEATNDAPYLYGLTEFRDSTSTVSIAWLPKRSLDVKSCEIAFCLRFWKGQDGKSSLMPISFQVPRKSDIFQADLYPDAYAGVSAMESADWLGGTNKPPVRLAMAPQKGGGSNQPARTASALVVKKSAAEYEEEIRVLHEQIAKLTAENESLKAK